MKKKKKKNVAANRTDYNNNSADAEKADLDDDNSADAEKADLDDDNAADVEKADLDADNSADAEKADLDADNSADVEKADLDDDNSAAVEKADLDADNSAAVEKADLDDDNSADVEKADLDDDNSADAEKADLDDDNSADVEKADLDADNSADVEKADLDDDNSADVEKADLDDDNAADAEKADLDDDNAADVEKADLDADNSADVEKADLDDDNSADAEKADLDDDNSADAEKADLDDDNSADVEKADLDDDNAAAVEKADLDTEENKITIEEMLAINRADCNGCEACANICPKKAIKMIRDIEGFAYPQINHNSCINCGRCNETCPVLNFEAKVINAFPMTVAAIYPDEKILRQSSSGGAFTALSEFILKNGGVIFGAGFSKNWRVRHAAIGDPDKLKSLRGIKYVQSKIGEVYKQVKKALSVTLVLFSGTPCQCAGLKHFLGRDYDNLLTVEIICQGMPSPELWESYIDRLGYAHDIASVNFCAKCNGGEQRMDINFFDQERKSSSIDDNLYGRFFQRNLSLRPSCHDCKFKFPNGQADLTLGNALGIEDFEPEMYDERGVSIVFIHTKKGANVLEKSNLKLREVKFSDALKKNPLFITSAVADSRREDFFVMLAENDDWYAVMQKYYSSILQNEDTANDATDFNERFAQIAAQVRQQFEKNILVVFTPANDNDRKNLSIFFERSFKNSGVYLLEPGEGSSLTCTESFSATDYQLKDVDELSDFVKQRNISAVFVKLPLDFGDGSPAMIDWLNNCGLPAKTFAQK